MSNTPDIFLTIYDVFNLKNDESPYSRYMGNYNASCMRILEKEGVVRILDSTQRMDGVSMLFEITDLGQTIKDFHEL